MEKLIFFGTSNFSAQIFRTLSKEYRIVLTVTQPDRAVGRKAETQESSVSKESGNLGIPTYKPESLKTLEAEKIIKNAGANIFIVVAYGKIIPKNILDIAKRGPINIHGSILPAYRGASPIHSALLNGDKSTGITIMLMDAEMDHGPILSSKSIDINRDETFIELEQRLAKLAESLILETIPKYLSGEIKPQEQDHNRATFTKIITKSDGKIDWNQSSEQIYNKYRAYIKWPGIWTIWDNKILKLLKVSPLKESKIINNQNTGDIAIGTVLQLQDSIVIKCGSEMLVLEDLQLEGKQKISASDFINGRPEFIGSILGD
jgi:methionyl-tRNA formyltransferase